MRSYVGIGLACFFGSYGQWMTLRILGVIAFVTSSANMLFNVFFLPARRRNGGGMQNRKVNFKIAGDVEQFQPPLTDDPH